jgi:hypothetical protein
MKYCDNLDCTWADEPLERISDYRIVDGAVLCIGCAEDPECAYCYNLVTTLEVPSVADDEMWELLAEEHDPECEWIATRAHVAV